MLWTSYAPECILNNLVSSQSADSIRTWYIYRDNAVKDILNTNFLTLGLFNVSGIIVMLDQNLRFVFVMMNGVIRALCMSVI